MKRLCQMFERLILPTESVPERCPPRTLVGFYLHFLKQTPGLFVALLLLGFAISEVDAAVPVIIGRFVNLVSTVRPQAFLSEAWAELGLGTLIMLVVRPILILFHDLVVNQAIAPGLANLVRWHSYWHVIRQSVNYFNSEFAGRLTAHVIQTGPALRESLIQATRSALYILIYSITSVMILSSYSISFTIPVIIWAISYAALISVYVPLFRSKSEDMSRTRSALTGGVADTYSNILALKLYNMVQNQDEFIGNAINNQVQAVHKQQRIITYSSFILAMMNAAMFTTTGAIGIWLWISDRVQIGAIATALPLVWQIAHVSGSVAQSVTSVFENAGVVHDGMRSISHPPEMQDKPIAKRLEIRVGEIVFEDASFAYGSGQYVLESVNLVVAPGERLGLVGRSGSGKSTLISVLLRLYELTEGRILIDGQDIAGVTQESLRSQIAVVTQDTSLLHRSVGDNIRLGKWDATDEEIEEAARRAHALKFILGLRDLSDRRGFDAYIGERGVKLSGGQRQRILLARAILKNAPILVLDEATSALDSESEAEVQAQLEELMVGRTVIAVAHRLSTVARMDRVAVLDQGRILELGRHGELLMTNGLYSRLWGRQSEAGRMVRPGSTVS